MLMGALLASYLQSKTDNPSTLAETDRRSRRPVSSQTPKPLLLPQKTEIGDTSRGVPADPRGVPGAPRAVLDQRNSVFVGPRAVRGTKTSVLVAPSAVLGGPRAVPAATRLVC